MDPRGLDGQVVRPSDDELRKLRDQFVVVRVVQMNDVDLSRFQFDYDLVFAIVFMNSQGRVYSRYGSRTRWNSDSRYSLAGLKHTMRRVLRVHGNAPDAVMPQARPVLTRELLGSNRGCMHCHQAWEGLRIKARRDGTFDPESLFVYPQPENIGLQLDVDLGNRVIRVKPDSPSRQGGLQPGDRITSIGKHRILSHADVTWALHNAEAVGPLQVRITRNGVPADLTLPLEKGWKETDLSWRASMAREQLPGVRTHR